MEPERYNTPFSVADAPDFPKTVPEVGGLGFNPARYADDDTWKKYVKVKGEHFMRLMQATDEGAGFLEKDERDPPSAASQWSGDLKTELATWFWHDGDYDKGWECDWDRIGLKNAFNALGLDAKPAFEDDGEPADGHNDCFSVTHYNEHDYEDPKAELPQMKSITEQRYTVRDKEYRATGGYYQFAVNKVDGAIIAINLSSPATSVVHVSNWGRKASPEELPDLRFCSDIYWAYWVRDNPNPKNLRVYGAYHVINDDTILLVSRAFKNKEVEALTPWPGTSFAADTDEGKALIGSPIGATIAHMLIGHKAELGIKRISKVTVVTNEPNARPKSSDKPVRDLHIFFQIEDVPPDEVIG